MAPQTSPPRSPQGSYASSPQSSQLSDLKARIDSGRLRIATLEAQIKPAAEELTRLNARMDPLAAEIKSLKEQQDAGTFPRSTSPSYNSKVKEYNALLAGHRQVRDANSADFQAYDELQKQDSDLVKQYNALLK